MCRNFSYCNFLTIKYFYFNISRYSPTYRYIDISSHMQVDKYFKIKWEDEQEKYQMLATISIGTLPIPQ